MNVNTFFIFLGLAGLSACQQSAEKSVQLFEQTDPEVAAMSASQLAFIDTLVDQYLAEKKFPGGVFLVARKGKIVYYKNLGYRSLKDKKTYQKDDIFRIASMTKGVTAVAIMQLYERGKLGLDDKISKYLPAFAHSQVVDRFNSRDSSFTTIPANREITIRQLLTHTSGLGSRKSKLNNLSAIYTKLSPEVSSSSHPTWTTGQMVDELAKLPLAFQPGERYLYGYNMDVLGRIIEVVSGMTLKDYFRENIFDPLEMVDTHFYLPEEKSDRLVPIYAYDNEEKLMDSDSMTNTRTHPLFKNARYYGGGGGLSSTAMDYAKFLQALLDAQVSRDSKLPKILGRKTIELMTSDQLAELTAQGKGRDTQIGRSYCLGFALTTGTGTDPKSPGSYEWGGSVSTKYFVDPQEELIFVGMSQAIPRFHPEFYAKVTSIIYGAIND